MSKPKLRLIGTDDGDWFALYLDGKSIHQGHDISIDQFFNLLRANNVSVCLDYSSAEAGPQDSERATERGSLPKTLDDLKDTDHE